MALKTTLKEWKTIQHFIELSKVPNNSTLILGQLWHEIKENELHRKYTGDEKVKPEDFLAQLEIKLSRYHLEMLERIYEFYILFLGQKWEKILGCDQLMLYRCKKFITKDNLDEWLMKIKTLSRSDIQRLVKYPDKDPMSCSHKWQELIKKYKCELCGETVKNI